MGFTLDENKALIAEKEEQIKRLQAEIKSLRGPQGIASLTKNLLVTARGTNRGGMVPRNGNSDEWESIVKVCLKAFKVSRVKDLSEKDVYTAAEMADEIIEVFNKYYGQIHKEK